MARSSLIWLLQSFLGVFGIAMGQSQDVVDGFLARMHEGTTGISMPYRLFVPEARVRVRPLPLIVYLHGGGGAGTDNLRQITGGNTAGTHVWAATEMQARHPSFVVAPQLPGENQWHVAIWAFHGAKDPTISVTGSRDLVAALRAVGSRVKYTEYPDAGHNVWTLAFAERELPDWLFAQNRARH